MNEAAARLLEAVCLLHAQGLERLRWHAYFHEMGTWRLELFPASLMDPGQPMVPSSAVRGRLRVSDAPAATGWPDLTIVPAWTSASGERFWGRQCDDATSLATHIRGTFAHLVPSWQGQDAAYADWHRRLLDAMRTAGAIPHVERTGMHSHRLALGWQGAGHAGPPALP